MTNRAAVTARLNELLCSECEVRVPVYREDGTPYGRCGTCILGALVVADIVVEADREVIQRRLAAFCGPR